MAKITQYKGYRSGEEPPIPKPAEPVQPNVVTVQDGLPLQFPGSEGVGVRVLHPTNPKAPSKNFGLTMYYLPPHVTSETASHYTEECYLVLRGSGDMILAGRRVPVKPGVFVHLPAWCEHAVDNTGEETMEILVCTAPTNP